MIRYLLYFNKNLWVSLILLLNLVCINYSCKKKQLNKEEFHENYASYVDLAEKYYDNNQLDSAYYYLLKIKKLFPEPPRDTDSTLIGLPNTLMGFYFEDMNQPDSALIYHKMAYQDRFLYFGENHPETSKSINNLGLLFQKYSEYNSAEAYFSKAISLVKDYQFYQKEYLKYTLNLSNNYYLEKDFRTSLNLLNNLSIGQEDENVGNIYLAKANNYMSLKDFNKAIYFLNKAFPLFDKNLLRKAQLANNLGNAYSRLNQETKALLYYKIALETRKHIQNITNNELGEIHTNISSSYLKLYELEKASFHFEQAKIYYLSNNPVNQLALSNIEEIIGQYHLLRFDIESAIKSYEQSQFLHDSILNTPSIESGNRYLTLANLYMQPPFRDTLKGLFYLKKVNKVESELLKLEALILSTSILINNKKYSEAKISIKEILEIESRINFENPIKQIEIKLQIATFYINLDEIGKARYINNLTFKLINELSIKNDIHYYRNLLKYEFLEIQCFLKGQNASIASKKANEKYQWIDSMQSNKLFLKKDRIINELKSSFIDYFFLAKIDDKKDLLSSFYYPYNKNKYPKSKNNSLFIRYRVAQDKIIIWTEINGRKDVFVREMVNPLDKSILSIRNAIREMPSAGEKSKVNYKDIYQNLIEKLSENLLPDIPLETESILFFPDQILTILPFEILVNPKDLKKQLIENYPISYHFITSPGIQKTRKKLKRKILAFSPDFQKDSRGFANLKYNETEIKKISEYYPTVPFKKGEASVKNFKKEASAYEWIHLATHSDPNLNSEEGGALIFSENIYKNEPSILYASEINSLKIRANLVVLSACQSSIGHYTPSQGMNGIAQAFLNAGAQSVVTSLWQVDDRSTAKFMEIFYHYLSKGYTKNKALQNTKKKMMHKMPYYWAPFILMGESGNI
jgi:CHAT domain-containing protein/tetratricopeptide (TPR) repeat protein